MSRRRRGRKGWRIKTKTRENGGLAIDNETAMTTRLRSTTTLKATSNVRCEI
jgi:hypothetical protein